MELLHKVGDKIKIRSDLKELYEKNQFHQFYVRYENGEKSNSWFGITRIMTRYSNNIAIITDICCDKNMCCYKIDRDFGLWSWTDDMFEDIDILSFESLI